MLRIALCDDEFCHREALSYLLQTYLDQAFALLARRGAETILVKNHETVCRLSLDDIVYAELCNRAVRYYLADGRTVDSLTLRESFHAVVAPLLKKTHFVMCGASFVVTLDPVAAVTKSGAS